MVSYVIYLKNEKFIIYKLKIDNFSQNKVNWEVLDPNTCFINFPYNALFCQVDNMIPYSARKIQIAIAVVVLVLILILVWAGCGISFQKCRPQHTESPTVAPSTSPTISN